jgi:hypothetical protein
VADGLENTISSNSSAVVCAFIAMETCFKKLLHSSGCLCDASLTPDFWLLGSCHIAPSLRLLIPRNIQAYHHVFCSEGSTQPHLWPPTWMAPLCQTGTDSSPSALEVVQSSFFAESACCRSTAPFLGWYAAPTMVLWGTCLH